MALTMKGVFCETGLGTAAKVVNFTPDNEWWNGSAYVAFNAANIADYAIALTELTGTGMYVAAHPSPGTPSSSIFVKIAGASLVASDFITGVRSTQTYGADELDATAIRAAIGLASANLDTQLSTIDTVVDTILADTGTDGVALSSATLQSIATTLLDLSSSIESSVTLRGAVRLILAASAGKLSGATTTTVTIRNVGDSKDRITATVDADGNRSAVTTDAT